MEIKHYDVIGFSGNSFVSKAIKKLTNSKWSHCGIVYEVNEKDVTIAEALNEGFVLKKHKRSKLEKKISKGKAIVRRMPKKMKLYYPRKVIQSYLGTKYGHFQILLNAISIVFKKDLIGDKVRSLTCSEAVTVSLFDMTFGKIDIATEFNTTPDFIYPEHVISSIQLIDVPFEGKAKI